MSKYVLYQHNGDVSLEVYLLEEPSELARSCISGGFGIKISNPKDCPNLNELQFLKITEGKYEYDTTKLQGAAIAILRQKRDAALEELDKAIIRHITNPDTLSRIESTKQELRDIPGAVDLSFVTHPVDIEHLSPPVLSTYKEFV